MWTTPSPCVDVVEIFPGLADRAKTTIRLHPRRLTDDEALPLGASKLGGDFLWPADEPWPVCEIHGIAWVGVLQLRRSDFPDVPYKPGSDLLQVLWCPQRGHGPYHNPEPVLYWRDSAAIGEPLEHIPSAHLPAPAEEQTGNSQSALEHDLNTLMLFQTHPDYIRDVTRHLGHMVPPSSGTWLPDWFLQMPAATDDDYDKLRQAALRLVEELRSQHEIPQYAEESFVPKPCRLYPEPVFEYPRELSEEEWEYLASLPPPPERTHDVQGISVSMAEVYEAELSAADGTKLGGYVHWSQKPEEPRCDRGHPMDHLLTIASAEWDAANWRRWRAREALEVDHRPTCLMLGDEAAKYVFICRQCDDWPVKSIIQD